LSLTTVLLLRPKIAHSRRIATTAIAARPQPVSQNVVVAGCVVVTSDAVVVVCEDVPMVASVPVPAGAACVFADPVGVAGCAAGAD
jgi:hypothetical protein